jgi:hypothetical protein
MASLADREVRGGEAHMRRTESFVDIDGNVMR